VTWQENIEVILNIKKVSKFLFLKYFLIYKKVQKWEAPFWNQCKTGLNTVCCNFIEIIDTKVTNFSLKTAAIIVLFGFMTTTKPHKSCKFLFFQSFLTYKGAFKRWNLLGKTFTHRDRTRASTLCFLFYFIFSSFEHVKSLPQQH
jgi:hypothetical protein